jgi:hypothetical protein
MDVEEIHAVVTRFRPLGFFAGAGPTDALAVDLATREDPWAGPLASWELDPRFEPACFSDLAVLAHDHARVLRLESWERLFDPRVAEIGLHCRDYGELSGHLGRIAAHRFALLGRELGPGRLSLVLDGRAHTITHRTSSPSMNPDFIRASNDAIASTGYRFVFLSTRLCSGYLVLLSHEEAERLRGERGWHPYGEP